MRKLLFLLFLLVVLFISSSQTYEQQSLIPLLQKWLPTKPLENLLSILEIPYWGRIVSVEARGYYYFVEFLIRKGAHIVFFGLIAGFIYSVLPKKTSRFTIAALLTLLIAIGDEYRQSLTGGRTQSTQDIILDMTGALLVLGIIWLVQSWKKRRKKTHRRK